MKLAYRIIALVAICGLLLMAAAAYALGFAGYERYSGYFVPIWDEEGKGVYFIQRDTAGFIWGAGWEHFSPPASSYVVSDRFSLRHVNAESGAVELLQTWPESPLTGRTTKHYRGRIFNTVSARVETSDKAATVVLRLNIPKVPGAEVWTLAASWRRNLPGAAVWEQKWRQPGGISDTSLKGGLEVIAVRGREAFPAAIVSVDAKGGYKVLVKNADFDDLYPDGIPEKNITERSWRPTIERIRTFKTTRTRLVAKHKAAGLSENEAELKATDDMEEIGLIPKRPRLVAQAITGNPDNLKEFTIPPDYLKAGLCSDIAAAIAAPGTLVDTGTGTYLKYFDDDVALRLKAWRKAGNHRFIVRTGDARYLLEVRRFN